MQMASKMTEPDYSRIYDDAIYNDGARISAGRFLKPRLEVELAFVMGEDLEGPGRRIYDVMRAAGILSSPRSKSSTTEPRSRAGSVRRTEFRRSRLEVPVSAHAAVAARHVWNASFRRTRSVRGR